MAASKSLREASLPTRIVARGSLANTPEGFGAVSRGLHWATAALMAAMVVLGLCAANLPRDSAVRDQLLWWHKSTGVLVLALTAVRLGWIAWSPPHASGRLRPWERRAARAGHLLLYAVLLAMPLSGLLMSEASGRPVSVYGLFTLPQVLALDPALPARAQPLYRLGKALHEQVLQWVLYAAFAAHLAGVVKHRLLDGDRSFLRRMWGFAPEPPGGEGRPA